MRIVGLDISLTSTGLAEWYDGARKTWHHGRTGKRADTLQERAARLDESIEETLRWVYRKDEPDRVLVESHTFAAKGGSQHDRSGLWWLVVKPIIASGVPVIEVSPSSLKLFATGKGNASKEEVLLAVVRRHHDVEFTTNDEADALTLVDMGLAHWDHAIFDPTVYQQRALDKVVWP